MKKSFQSLFAISSIFAAFFLFNVSYSQSGTIDNEFNFSNDCGVNGTGANGTINCTAIQGDGKILVGGNFSSYNGLLLNSLARLNVDGTVDQGFNIGSGFNGEVFAIAIQDDNKILVGGNFTEYNGITSFHILRLNPDGTPDASFPFFNSYTGPNDLITCILVENNKILVGGDFQIWNGGYKRGIARLNLNGSFDNTFNHLVGFSPSTGAVRTIKLDLDGRILVGGGFTNGVNGASTFPANRIARLNENGGIDNTFNYGTGFASGTSSAIVNSIEVQQDGKIIIGGYFDQYNGTMRNKIIRLNTDGYIDQSFNIGSGFTGSSARVNSIEVQQDGKIIIGGYFDQYNGTMRNNIIRLNTDGYIDQSFNIDSGFTGSSATVNSLKIQSDEGIIVASLKSVIRLESTGARDPNFNNFYGFNGPVHSFAIQTDGKIIVGGQFRHYDGFIQNKIVRLFPNGQRDSSFITGTGFSTTGVTVRSINIQQDGKIIIGGDFIEYNGIPVNRIVRLNIDGSIDNSFNANGAGFNNGVYRIVIQQDGKILVSGEFTEYNGLPANRLVRLNIDGSIDNSFSIGTGFNNFINDFIVQNDDKVVLVGIFTDYNGVSVSKIIRLNSNGSIDNSFNVGLGFNAAFNEFPITIDEKNGKFIIGGPFTEYNGIPVGRIVRLNNDGSIDNSFITGTGFNNGDIRDAIVQNDGKVVLVGNFTNYNGVSVSKIIRLNSNGSIDNSFNVGLGFNASGNEYPLTIVEYNGKFIIGGYFSKYNNFCRNNIVMINGDCPGSFTTDQINACGSYTWVNGVTYSSSVNNVFYTLSNSLGCDSIVSLNLAISDIPSTPLGDIQQVFCSGTISDLVANGNQIQWYSSANGSAPLSSNTNLVNNTTYYASQTENGCESQERLAVTVSIDAPNMPTGSSTQSFCNSAYISDLIVSGTQIQWYSSATGGAPLSPNTILTNNTTYYGSQTENGCESQERLGIAVSIDTPDIPTGSITQSFCNNATISDLVANGTQIQWYSNETGGTPLSSNTVLSNNTTYYASQTLNGCESQNRLAIFVSVIPAPNSSVTSSGSTLTADQQGASYQWLDCDNSFAPIQGENQISFTPANTGNYAVQITQNDCTVNSDCYYAEISSVGIEDLNADNGNLNVYPNPNNGIFIIENVKVGKYKVVNSIGQILIHFEIDTIGKKELNIGNIAKGVYYIVSVNGHTKSNKIIIY